MRARHGAVAEADAEAADGGVHPHETLAARERMRYLRAALDRLQAEQRVVLALFAVDGFGHAEIAGILGIPECTVWSRLHNARKALAAMLG
jgi:RNA polymerase sigma-70 factor (ECF subfamily)